MGFGGISIWQLLIVLAIIVVLFGTKKLRNLGGDLGSAVKSFKSAVREGDKEGEDAARFEADPPALDENARSDEAASKSSERQAERQDRG